MKGLRFLLLGLAICLASGVKAQFYDGPDDIYYYVKDKIETIRNGETIEKKIAAADAYAYVFNFDGKNAAVLAYGCDINTIKNLLRENPNCFEDKVETADYNWKFIGKSYDGVIYENPNKTNIGIYTFSLDRKQLVISYGGKERHIYKKVDKSYFKVGRSRTPSGTLHE